MSGTGTGTVVTNPLTYTTIAEADVYFRSRLGADAYWTETANKTAALATAERDLSTEFDLTATDDTSAPADYTVTTAVLKCAVYEQALFRLRDAAGIEARASLQAQGVASAGIVSEAYSGANAGRVPICGYARQVLAAVKAGGGAVSQFVWER